MNRKALKVVKGGSDKPSRWRRRFFLLAVLILCGYLLYHSLIFFTGALMPAVIVRQVSDLWDKPVYFVVLKDEHALVAPVDGRYVPAVEPGQRVKSGQTVGAVQSGELRVPVTAPVAGLVSHNLDGWEEELPLAMTLNERTVALLGRVQAEFQPLTAPDLVHRGQIVAVVVSNNRFALAASLAGELEGVWHTVRFDTGSGYSEIDVRVRQTFRVGDRCWVKWDAPLLPDSLALNRVLPGSILVRADSLFELPAKAVFRHRDEPGVVLVQRGQPSFLPVDVVQVDGDTVMVTGLADGQQVLVVPRWAKLFARWWLD